MAGKTKADEYPPPVMPFDGEVDAIEPEVIEFVPPYIDAVESSVPIVDPVAPVFSPDDDPQPAPDVEPDVEPDKPKGRK